MHLFLIAVLAAAPLKLAVPTPTAVGIDAALTDALIDRFATQLAVQGPFTLVSSRDIAQMMGLERQKQMLGCADAACTAELAAALGVDAVLTATIVKSGKSISTTLRVLKGSNGAVIAQDTHRGPDTDATQDWLDELVVSFAQRIRAGLGAARTASVEGSTHSPNVAPLVVGGLGVALAIGGAVALGLSAGDAAELQATPPPSLTRIDQLEASGPTKRWVGVGLLVGAGVGLGTALVLALTGSQPKVTVMAAPNEHGGFAAVQGEW